MDSTGVETDGSSQEAALAAAFAEALGAPAGPEAATFVARFAADYLPEELPGWSLEDLARAFAGLWTLAAEAPEGAVRLERAPTPDAAGRPLDILSVVEPDKPFVVDSIMGELGQQGLDVRAMFHTPIDVDGAHVATVLVVLGAVGEDRRQPVLDGVAATLGDVRAAVGDFPEMAALMKAAIAELAQAPVRRDRAEVEEQLAFLRWLDEDRFVFLGARTYDYPRGEDGEYLPEQPRFDPAESLGVLREASINVLRRASEPAVLSASPRAYYDASPAVVVAKSNVHARVHRRAYMDYIGVRRYDAEGQVRGEIRFVGLFTAEAYEEPARALPLLRRKVEHVLAQAEPGGHAERRLRHILESYPRDELFQVGEDELLPIAMGILHLYDRPGVRLFARKDPFDRFVSLLLFTPRERYSSEMQERVGAILARAWQGRVSAVYPSFAEGPLARLHIIIGLDPGAHPDPELGPVEAELVEAVRTWGDRFEAALREGEPPAGGVGAAIARWAGAFPAGYRDRNDAADALADVAVVDGWGEDEPIRVRAFRRDGDGAAEFRFKLYVRGEPAPLSDVLPVLEHMGLRVLEESGFALTPAPPSWGSCQATGLTEGAPEGAGDTSPPPTRSAGHLPHQGGGEAPRVWIHEYRLVDAGGKALETSDLEGPFGEAFVAVWTGATESDGFNRLVLAPGLSWRQAALIRALAKWRQQSGLDPSQAVQETALRDHPELAQLILDLFAAKFDPAAEGDVEARKGKADALGAEIEAALQAVASLDADRVLRRLAGAVQAATRTNYYQTDEAGAPKLHISIKFDAQAVRDLPAPRPFREVFVASPRVEGVHLRFGPVARGGLRWSDRRDDYRTEVLGLVKAQQVKNAVIVPVGAKGGFFPKRLPREAGAAQRAEAVEAYKVYLAGLLDLTDDLDADGAVQRPPNVIAHDADDPYLVVAADKGTASFSDIANGVAEAYGFWLGDAFASGGSAGYDHKAMGITARGAWEAVKRHFRELGKDIQSEPFTCIGVGDMSGDVFGNGMLRSRATKLVAAFDHRHIFLDPEPDPEASFAERERLFALPTSSWGDYDTGKISAGGGVFPRTAKSVALTPEVRALLGVEDEALAPTDLIRAILKAPAELLYLGGIGNYVKGPLESHAEVMDKANDAVRIDATELRVKVVGEGANLGFTQAARIAYARAGGRINTDAIDNSAGVDTSDHEVNIKILLGQAERSGGLTREERDELLRSMTEEVAAHVLAHNYAQTLSLSLQQASAPADLGAHERFMAGLVAAGRLDRKVEGLPGPNAIAELEAQGQGLTRPELAVLNAYAKLELSAELVTGAAPDDPGFEVLLERYFPSALERFEAERRAHRLRREIIAMMIANAMVDMCGATFPDRLKAALGCDAGVAAVAFEAARRIFRLDEAWARIDALDLEVSVEVQTALYQEVSRVLRAQTYWLASKAPAGEPPQVEALVEAYQACADALRSAGEAVLSGFGRDQAAAARAQFTEAGAPEDLAAEVAALGPMTATVEIADLARGLGWPCEAAARLFHQVGDAFGFDRLKAAAAALTAADAYEQMALRRMIAELIREQTAVTAAVADGGSPPDGPGAARAAVDAWVEARSAVAERARKMVEEIEAGGAGWSFAKLTLANAALRELAG